MFARELYEAACEYRDLLDWRIIPIGRDKKPMVRWAQYQKREPEPEEFKSWFSRRGIEGIAVLNGRASNNLVCRDFDTEESYERWASEWKLATMLPTVKTRRGSHIYFRCDVLKHNVDLPNHEGELRYNGVNILPPSAHQTGTRYQWTVSPFDIDRIPILPPNFAEEFGWRKKEGVRISPNGTEKTESTEETEITEKTEEIIVVCVDSELEPIIRRCLPKQEGVRHRQVFDLARELKTLHRFRESNPRCFEQVLRRWHELALPVIGTKPWEETWFDFLNGWPLVRYFKDELSVEAVAEQAREIEVAEARKYEEPKLRHLAAICHQLQVLQGAQPFFLSCRTAANLIDVTHQEAHRWLRGLVLDGLLKEVEKGIAGGTRATRFRFLGKLSASAGNGKADR